MAWLAATRIPGVAAAVGYYGGGIADTASEQPKCPVMLHFGETDDSIPADHWAKVRAAHPKLPVHVYQGAGHGFSCDERASFHKASHVEARERRSPSSASTSDSSDRSSAIRSRLSPAPVARHPHVPGPAGDPARVARSLRA